jgi:hypothetical protein
VIVFPGVNRIREIFIRTVEVDVVVVIAVEKRADVERAAQADEMTDNVWVTKRNIRGVVRAEAGPTNCDAMGIAFASREIEHVANDHIFVRVVRPHSVGRVNRFIVKTFEIDRVRAVNSDFAVVDVPCEGTDQPEILVFVITGVRSCSAVISSEAEGKVEKSLLQIARHRPSPQSLPEQGEAERVNL